MLRGFWIVCRANYFVAAMLVVASCAVCAPAQTIGVSLNVFYDDPSDLSSGGSWEIVAKSDGFGIAGVEVLLTGIDEGSELAVGPTGQVNSADLAGFSVFAPYTNPLEFRSLTIGQKPIGAANLDPGDEEAVFYGVGTLTNGWPDFSGAPMGSNMISPPAFSSLSGTSGLPWATGDVFEDAAWDTAAILATGTFSDDHSPGFYAGGGFVSSGQVFTSAGTSTTIGSLAMVDPVSTIVRTNYLPDYNHNGTVDAADYALWRDTYGMTGMGLDADGNGDEIVDDLDYDLWRQHFGEIVVSGSGAGGGAVFGVATVPEPCSGGLLLGALTMLFLPRIRVFLRPVRFS